MSDAAVPAKFQKKFVDGYLSWPNGNVDRAPAIMVSKVRNGPTGASVQHFGTPVMGIGLWGLSPLCEIGISTRSVYQMTASREQARGEGNCARATERGKEACEWLGKRRVCRQPSVRHPLLECILTKSARLRTETSYKAGSVRRVSQTSRMPLERYYCLSIDLVKGELVKRKPMLLSGEICAAPGSKSSRQQLLDGTYQPQPVRRVTIDKPDGGKRLLGIPNLIDRLIQQAIVQILTPVFDPGFSDSSYGFRPKRFARSL
jgi:hypothetical protein